MRVMFNLSRLDYCAVLLALLLTASCLWRGLVYDESVFVMLCLSVPLMWFALNSGGGVHPFFLKMVSAVIILLGVWVCLQRIVIDDIDISAWNSSVGRLIFVAIVCTIALQIGSDTAASRLFLLSLLYLGIISVGITFVLHQSYTSSGSAYYAHAFVNPNNAASYLGIMIMLCIIQMNRFGRQHFKWQAISIPERIDNLRFISLLHLLCMLFGAALFLSALLLTRSRGGIVISLAVCAGLIFVLTIKHRSRFKGRFRSISLLLAAVATLAVTGWIFGEHGEGLKHEIVSQGFNPEERPSLFSAVIPMIMERPFLGYGIGNFAAAFPAYRSLQMPVEGIFDKAHSTYLEIGVEMGIIITGMILLVTAVLIWRFVIGIRERRNHYEMPSMGLAITLLMALHSTFDFPLQIPAILALVVAVLVVCAVQSDKHYVPSKRSKKRARGKVRKY